MWDKLRNKYCMLYISMIFYLVPLIIVPFYDDIFYHFKIFVVYLCSFIFLVIYFRKIKGTKIQLYLEDYFLLGFLIMAIISTIFSVDVLLATYGEVWREEGLMAIMCYILIYFITSRTFKPSEKFIKYTLLVFIFICSLGIIQFFFKDLKILYDVKTVLDGNAFSTIGNRNFASSYIIIILPLCIFGYMEKGNKFYLVGLLIGYTALLGTFTRSGWLAFSFQIIVSLGYFIKKKINRTKARRICIMLSAFLCLTVFVNVFSGGAVFGRYLTIGTDLVKTISKRDEGSGTDRIFIWKRALKLIAERPIIGSGPDTFGLVFMDKFGKETFQFHNRYYQGKPGEKLLYITINKAHNEYLQIAATMGIPALIFYIAFIIMSCWKLFKALKLNIKLLPLLISILGYMIQAFFNISVVSVAPLFWAVLGIAASQHRMLNNKQT